MELISDTLDLTKWMEQPPEAVWVRPVSEYSDDVQARFDGRIDSIGKHLPWASLNKKIGIRTHELTIWSGINGSGKSMLLNQVMLHLAAQGERICFASLEMPPASTVYRLTRQGLGPLGPFPDTVREFLGWTDGKMWLYEQNGTPKWPRMVALARYCHEQLGITQFVLDSLMKCSINSDDYNTQKLFVDQLCALAKDSGLSVHLVAHMRKSGSEHDRIDKFSIKGASEITDLADTVWTLWRNKPKEAEFYKRNPDPEIMAEADAILECVKNRHGEWEGKLALAYDQRSLQFLDRDSKVKAWTEYALRQPGEDDE